MTLVELKNDKKKAAKWCERCDYQYFNDFSDLMNSNRQKVGFMMLLDDQKAARSPWLHKELTYEKSDRCANKFRKNVEHLKILKNGFYSQLCGMD
ncbi:759_t:CDS:2 [Funneliformis geosporum]|uniref:11804_t:CDS:1 n=1 Tax=Funneliformis geosporum TaxID=1117311 RepID=A0A9W4SH81_9GLOM|nr:759_t:CDS:2 [Funneliformis geosporum]CAI2168989.1 11804_t:CDS:2 [Funneliformis geosporum]